MHGYAQLRKAPECVKARAFAGALLAMPMEQMRFYLNLSGRQLTTRSRFEPLEVLEVPTSL